MKPQRGVTIPSRRAFGVAIMQVQLQKAITTTTLSRRSKIGMKSLESIQKGKREVRFREMRSLASALEMTQGSLLALAEKMEEQLAETRRVKSCSDRG